MTGIEPFPAPAQTELSRADRETILKNTMEEIGHINGLVTEIGGPNASIDSVLPRPPEPRDAAPDPKWTEEQILKAREVAATLGFGAEHDMPSGLERHVIVLEGGRVWKMLAEEQVADKEKDPSSVIYAGTIHYIPDDDERHMLLDQKIMTTEQMKELDENSSAEASEGQTKRFTQYDFAVWLAKRRVAQSNKQKDIAEIKPTDLPYGYELSEGNPTTQESTGQFSAVGMNGSESVGVLRVDQEWYDDEQTGNRRFRHRPDPAKLMRFVSDVLADSGDASDLAFITSNAYVERRVDTIRAGIESGRRFELGVYGRQTMADVRDRPIEPAGPKLNQLPGSLRRYRDQSLRLAEELGISEHEYLKLLTSKEIFDQVDELKTEQAKLHKRLGELAAQLKIVDDARPDLVRLVAQPNGDEETILPSGRSYRSYAASSGLHYDEDGNSYHY